MCVPEDPDGHRSKPWARRAGEELECRIHSNPRYGGAEKVPQLPRRAGRQGHRNLEPRRARAARHTRPTAVTKAEERAAAHRRSRRLTTRDASTHASCPLASAAGGQPPRRAPQPRGREPGAMDAVDGGRSRRLWRGRRPCAPADFAVMTTPNRRPSRLTSCASGRQPMQLVRQGFGDGTDAAM